MVKLAACQYSIDLIESWDAYAHHLTTLVGEAARQGAELALLPEYAAMVLAGQLDSETRSDLHGSIAGIQPLIPRWVELCAEIAANHNILFSPGSAPVLDADGQYRNRAFLFGPQGLIGVQDKQIMTRFEREKWFIAAGVHGLKTFDTPIGKLGILICYDNEFPILARNLAEQGADLILAPSCTDTLAGSYRVRIGRRRGRSKTRSPFWPPHRRQCALVPCHGREQGSRRPLCSARLRHAALRRLRGKPGRGCGKFKLAGDRDRHGRGGPASQGRSGGDAAGLAGAVRCLSLAMRREIKSGPVNAFDCIPGEISLISTYLAMQEGALIWKAGRG